LANSRLVEKGQPTRFVFDEANARAFITDAEMGAEIGEEETRVEIADFSSSPPDKDPSTSGPAAPGKISERGNKVFITHGKNKKILEQVKELVAFGKFEPVVAQEREPPQNLCPTRSWTRCDRAMRRSSMLALRAFY